MDGLLTSCDHLDPRQFEIVIKRLADSLGYGTDRSPFLGSGVEYVQSRCYEPGDSVRAIDWRVTARTGKYHVKEYEAPKQMPLWLAIDTSASMTIASGKRSKYANAVHIAGGLALASLDRVSPVGILGIGSRPVRIRPSLAREQIYSWLHSLRRFRYDESTTLARRLAELGPSLKERCLVVILSDLHDPQAMSSLKRLNQIHDCVVVQLQDPAEKDLRGVGFFRGQEAETGRAFVSHGRRQWARGDDEVQVPLRRAGIDHLLLPTDEPYSLRLRQFFKSRGLLGRGAR